MSLAITDGKGFRITFENKWTISVQFGYGNYSDNYDLSRQSSETYESHQRRAGEGGSSTAEVAIIAPDNTFYSHPKFDGDSVGGYMTSEEVAELIAWTSSRLA